MTEKTESCGRLLRRDVSAVSDFCTCYVNNEQQNIHTHSKAKCKADHRNKDKRRNEQTFDKIIERKESCNGDSKKSFFTPNIKKKNEKIVNIMNIDERPHGGFKFRYRSTILEQDDSLNLKNSEGAKECCTKYKKDNVDHQYEDLRCRYNTHSPNSERNKPSVCVKIAKTKKEGSINQDFRNTYKGVSSKYSGDEDKLEKTDAYKRYQYRPHSSSIEKDKVVSNQKKSQWNKQMDHVSVHCYRNCQERNSHNTLNCKGPSRTKTRDSEKQIKALYSRKKDICLEEKSIGKNKTGFKDKCKESYGNNIHEYQKYNALKEMYDHKRPANKYSKKETNLDCMEASKEIDRKEECCNGKKNQHAHTHKYNEPSDKQSKNRDKQSKNRDKQVPPKEQLETQKKDLTCEMKKSSSNRIKILIEADNTFQVGFDHQRKSESATSISEFGDVRVCTSKESMTCSHCRTRRANKSKTSSERPTTRNKLKEKKSCKACQDRSNSCCKIRSADVCRSRTSRDICTDNPINPCIQKENTQNTQEKKDQQLLNIRGLCSFILNPFGSYSDDPNQQKKSSINVDKNEGCTRPEKIKADEKDIKGVKQKRVICCEKEVLDNIFGQIDRLKNEVKTINDNHERVNTLVHVESLTKENGDLKRNFEKLERLCEKEREKCKILWDRMSQAENAAEMSPRCDMEGINDCITGALERIQEQESKAIEKFNSFAKFTLEYREILKDYYRNISSRADKLFETKQKNIDEKEKEMKEKYEAFIHLINEETKQLDKRIEKFKEKCEDYENQSERQMKSIEFKNQYAEKPQGPDFKTPQCKTDWSRILDPNCDNTYSNYKNIQGKNSCFIEEKKCMDASRKRRQNCYKFGNNNFAYYEKLFKQPVDSMLLYNRSFNRIRCENNYSSRQYMNNRNLNAANETYEVYTAMNQTSQTTCIDKYHRSPKYRSHSCKLKTYDLDTVSQPPAPSRIIRSCEKNKCRFSLFDRIRDFVRGPSVEPMTTDNLSNFTSLVTIKFIPDDELGNIER